MTNEDLVTLLRSKFSAHTILLYGSRARGDFTADSDWDASCVAPVDEERHYGWREGGAFMDVFVYPAFAEPTPDDLRMLGARVLLDERGEASQYLEKLAALDARGPTPMPAHQLAMETTWITKMVERARRGANDPTDLEAHYRRHWLLKDLLEYAFSLRGRWYRGPKAGLVMLRQDDPALHALFADALQPNAPFASVERVATAVAALASSR